MLNGDSFEDVKAEELRNRSISLLKELKRPFESCLKQDVFLSNSLEQAALASTGFFSAS